MSGGSWIRINAVTAGLDAKTVNSIIADALGKRAVSITQMPELRKEIGEEFVLAVTPLVPKKTGQLYKSGRATDDGRVYWTAMNKGFNYAYTVYDPEYERWGKFGEYKKPTTPETYPHWVERMQPGTEEYSNFITNITPIIIRRFAEYEQTSGNA
jgi:hypothetical protein